MTKVYLSSDSPNPPLTLTVRQQQILDSLEHSLFIQNRVKTLWVEQKQVRWAFAYLLGVTDTAKALGNTDLVALLDPVVEKMCSYCSDSVFLH